MLVLLLVSPMRKATHIECEWMRERDERERGRERESFSLKWKDISDQIISVIFTFTISTKLLKTEQK